ncbi:TPA: DsdX permease [Klebsiella pneumoniae]
MESQIWVVSTLLISIVLIVLTIVKLKFHPFLALLLASFFVGAMMGATAIVAPMLPLYPGVSPEIIAIAIGSGAIGCTIVTDSLFWLVKQYCGASLSETFKYYTTATFIASLLALAATFLLSFII